jgi:rhodanese-related sulfurtransferase
MRTQILFLISFASFFSSQLLAIDENEIPEKLKTIYGLYLTPHEAYNLKTAPGADILLVDIRSRPELKFIGASDLIDANIPSRFINTQFTWSDKANTYRTVKNTHFVADFEKLLSLNDKNKDTPIILICQSGSRVPKAADLLFEAGFKTVYSLYQGFEGIKAKTGVNKGQRRVNGWKNADLPWSYKLNKEAMYFNFDASRTEASD